MTALRTSLLAASLLTALATSVMAQPGMDGMAGQEHRGGHHGQRVDNQRDHMAARQPQRLADLRDKLRLQPAQEAAWKTFADAMQPPAASAARPDRVSMAKLSTPERIDQMLALHEQRTSDMKKRGEAAKTFYAGLDAEQKKTFDSLSARWMGGHGHHARHH